MDEVSDSLGRIAESAERLLATTAALTGAQAREPSLLPGWSRGHVLTHIARNAGGLGAARVVAGRHDGLFCMETREREPKETPWLIPGT